MYSPLIKSIVLFLLLSIFYSCTPRIILNEDVFIEDKNKKEIKKINQEKTEENQLISDSTYENQIIPTNANQIIPTKIISEIEIILPDDENFKITENFINSLELSIYKKNITSLSLNINLYSHKEQLHKIIRTKTENGKIFIGPLTSNNTKDLETYCSYDIIFFTFASDRQLAKDCIYLINFFPEDDLITLFNYFDSNARIALLYPENHYGYYINGIIDKIANDSDAIIVNKVSYREDASNVRDAIKNLGEYEMRKNELERQKNILQNKSDNISKKALKKIEKFETIGSLNFTHLIIADYNIRLLEIAPLLPFYDIDPNKIQFVGTGVWDDMAFFDEPSLQRAIFPGIEFWKRKDFFEKYTSAYNSKPIRTTTIMYDLIGLINYIIENKLTLESTFELLNNKKLSFDGIDGRFSFEDNLIKRDLDILRIIDGQALLIK